MEVGSMGDYGNKPVHVFLAGAVCFGDAGHHGQAVRTMPNQTAMQVSTS